MKKYLALLTICLFLAGCLSSSVPLIPETDLVLPFRGDTKVMSFDQDDRDPTRWKTESSQMYTLKRHDKKYSVYMEGHALYEIAFANLDPKRGRLLVQFKILGKEGRSNTEYSYGIAEKIGDKLFYSFPQMRDVSSGHFEELWNKYDCKGGPLRDKCRDFQSYAEVREVLGAAWPEYRSYLLIR
ncbi:hypothetical protein sS8_2534 [Methylocaldum marinum]|uniref:Lipoprotein n=1 Tax=Methylocaldum marinum TaxID=1432792 RepID=A0A250KSH0_9GAMM|nr:hypothetical protein [Methylocaldum marinum]BBA34486.1 hypothetical protein sS8_2534 [Methylocaldum marinum]